MANAVTSVSLTRRIRAHSPQNAQSASAAQGNLDQVRQDNTVNANAVAETTRQLAVEKDARRAKRIEHVSNAVLSHLDKRMSTDEGLEALATQVDGRKRGTRNLRQRTRKNRFKIKLPRVRKRRRPKVVAIRPGDQKTIVTNSGEAKVAKLERHEKAKVIEGTNGDKTILVSTDLSDQQAATTVANVEAKTVIDVAKEVGMEVQSQFEALFTQSTFTYLRDVFSINVWFDIGASIDNTADDHITERVIEQQNLSQQRIQKQKVERIQKAT